MANTFTHVRLNCNSSPHHMTLIKDHSTTCIGVKINLHSSTSLIKISVKSTFPYKYQPSSGLSSSLLMKTSCLRLKLVELNFFASFSADDQRKTYVSDVSKYTFKSSRRTFSTILYYSVTYFERNVFRPSKLLFRFIFINRRSRNDNDIFVCYKHRFQP